MAVPAYNKVNNIPIAAPSGVMVRPKMMQVISGNLLITECHWIDPRTNRLFKKGTFSIVEREQSE